jgi:hypothetical protein
MLRMVCSLGGGIGWRGLAESRRAEFDPGASTNENTELY